MQQQTMNDQNPTSQPAMAQQMAQQAPQQISQQMVLCPVRVVYETQILMQPDQMHPNQTFFINSQNQPPWIHNRQIPNQIFYLQHAPNNIIPSMPQQTEQNHFYLQQPYQQIVQHPMLAQNQENIMRSYQMPNVMTTNVIQNVQNNNASSFPNQISQHNDATPNYGLINSNVGSNIPITQINTMPVDRQDTIMQGMQNQNITNQKQMYINVGQQTNQQAMVRPHMTLNPMQQTNSSVQMFEQTNQIQNITTNTPQIVPRTFVSAKVNTQPIRMRPMTVNNVTPTNIRTIDQNYTCRPIKPRPEYKPNIPSFPNTQMQIPQVINTVNMNPNLYNKLPNPPATTIPNNDTIKMNRKRKSESPDDLTPKLTVVNINNTIAQALVNNHAKSIDVGINTSPIHKPISYALHKPNHNDVPDKMLAKTIPPNLKPNSEDHKTIDTQNSNTQEDPETKSAIDTKEVKQDDNNKLIRYTVFPQSRVRPKEEVKVNILKDTKNIINEDDKKPEHKAENSKILLKEKILNKNDEKNVKVNDALLTGVNANVMNTKDSNEKGKEYVLTHVLDGLVIQESNIAFPIRDSTKKVIQTDNKCSDRKREVVKVDELLKNNCLELPIAGRKIQEKITAEEDKKGDIDNPFDNVNATTVKSWTIGQLTSFLSKYKWDETVSLLQDHEIDGESLFLVSKSQLMHIGIKEKHADIICDYVRR